MAEAQRPYDIQTVLEAVEEDLVDDIDIKPVFHELEKAKVFRRSTLRDIHEENPTTTKQIKALLYLMKKEGYSKYDQFKFCLSTAGQQSLVDIIEAAEKGEEYKPDGRRKPMTSDEKLLQEDLMTYYLEKESTMPVAPLVEQHEAELTSFYVKPPMMAYKKPNAFGQVKQSKEEKKMKIHYFRELFLNDNETYKRIYVTADAGMGKTSFSKMLARTWCQAHKPENSVEAKFRKDDLDTMKKFDFLFLIHLREYKRTKMCGLDEMVRNMLQTKLPRTSSYTLELLEQVLCSKQCLIIVDGLDEWSHPEHGPEKAVPQTVIPHIKCWPDCSVLTTTRPWKLSTAQLSAKDIDRQVEISQLDDATSGELKKIAIKFLNENQTNDSLPVAGTKPRRRGNFDEDVSVKRLQDIRYIPYILLQMICLWFKNCPVGKTLCEVYSNIIELTLTRWLVKTDSGHTDCKCKPSEEHENIECMKNNTHSGCYMPLLLKAGQLAFSTLFKVNQEESLLFEKKQVSDYLNDEEINNCLNMGLLSQIKDTTCLTEERVQLYFPHKTFHEFFCALFIVTNWNKSATEKNFITQTISNKCRLVYDIVEMSKVFVFVCGMNPSVYSDISHHLATIVDQDQKVKDYRNSIEEMNFPSELYLYQSMQVSCFQESIRNTTEEENFPQSFLYSRRPHGIRNKQTKCKIVLEDIIVLQERLTGQVEQALEKILSDNASDIKSLYAYHLTHYIKSILEQSVLSRLEILRLRYSNSPWPQFPSTVPRSLKYLMLEGINNLQEEEISAISSLNSLHGLRVSRISFLSRDGIFGRSTDTFLRAIFHDAAVLEKLILEDLSNPPRMSIPALPRLRKFTLRDCDLRDSVTLSPDLTSLETIELMKTTASIPCWEELFLSVSKLSQNINVKLQDISMNAGDWKKLLFDVFGKLQKPIHVEMVECKGPSQEEWSKIFDDMEASGVFCVKESYFRNDVEYANIVSDTLGV